MLVSVIIPVYNVAEYIEETINSVLSQDYLNIELIVINDGSTDGSGDILDRLKSENKKINVYHKKNEGLSKTRNFGIGESHGDFYMFLDGDDILSPNSVSKCVETFKENPLLDLVLFDAKPFFDEGCSASEKRHFTYQRNQNLYQKIISGKDFFECCIKLNCYIPSACLYMVRSDTLGTLRFYPGIYHEDHLFTTSLLLSPIKIYLLKEKLYLRRFRNGSITTVEKNEKHALGYLTVAEELIKENRGMIENLTEFNRYLCDLIYATIEIADSKSVNNKSITRRARDLFNTYLRKDPKYIIKIKYTALFDVLKRFIR